jgi:hypothetical protein
VLSKNYTKISGIVVLVEQFVMDARSAGVLLLLLLCLGNPTLAEGEFYLCYYHLK